MPRPVQNIVVVGLGYVGLPLAAALSRHYAVTGLDVDGSRIDELRSGYDRTGELTEAQLREAPLQLTADPAQCPAADIYIVTVPTPIDADNRPDLSLVLAASRTVGAMIDGARRPIIVYESTVYPGVTEDLCGPALSAASGLVCGCDFTLGYSPERINPGDKVHSVDKITKVVAGSDAETLATLADLYGRITSDGVHRAASIKVAEAAKVIENAQRDINIAFMNEVAQISALLGLSIWDILAAAGTKWNFLPFQPGLVGGHCIGVDPYYLSHLAREMGHDPKVILSGRATNDGMADWLADRLHAARDNRGGSALVLGLTFKENVPDLRNSKVADVIAGLARRGHRVSVHDPLADPAEAMHEYGITLCDAPQGQFDLVLLAVPHDEYLAQGADKLAQYVAPKGVFVDLKNALGIDIDAFPTRVWTL
ncbi:MAG: nucleotide sugar dehydrogenase [Sphingomonadaceae bacterium]|nr:nucleotide sugar dehydrogenase [Sphingomonadaceae bacterium]